MVKFSCLLQLGPGFALGPVAVGSFSRPGRSSVLAWQQAV